MILNASTIYQIMQQNEIKKEIANQALLFIEENMTIGLGTGTTATAFIHALAKKQLRITAVATSLASEQLALDLGIHCVPVDHVHTIDLTFDGADQIDPKKRMIKGAGGALLREKIIAASSNELVVLIEEKKQVQALGHTQLPVEILPFAHRFTAAHLEKLGYQGAFRQINKNIYTTDNGNYIYDIFLDDLLSDPEKADREICSIPGVITTGLFFSLAGRVVIGKNNGTVVIED